MQHVQRGELLRCVSCKGIYHYKCLNIKTEYYHENKNKLLNSWRCPNCENVSKQRKNDNTPIRGQLPPTLNNSSMSIDDQIQEDYTILGNTDAFEDLSLNVRLDITNPQLPDTESITLNSISKLLDIKLEQHKQSILCEIRNTVQSELNTALLKLRLEFTQKTQQLQSNQSNINSRIENITEKIEVLEVENAKLKNYIEQIRFQPSSTVDYSKRIVVYGLNEYSMETDYNLEERIINAFQITLNVDLTGYIEEIHRIGRNGTKRPVKFELISKRMTKYILRNKRYLKSQGLYISEYLDKEQRKRWVDSNTTHLNTTTVTEKNSKTQNLDILLSPNNNNSIILSQIPEKSQSFRN